MKNEVQIKLNVLFLEVDIGLLIYVKVYIVYNIKRDENIPLNYNNIVLKVLIKVYLI